MVTRHHKAHVAAGWAWTIGVPAIRQRVGQGMLLVFGAPGPL
jgi:hypothetical protein